MKSDKLAAIILAKPMGMKEKGGDYEKSEDKDMMYKDSAKEILGAVKKNDPKALAESLKYFVQMCVEGEDDY